MRIRPGNHLEPVRYTAEQARREAVATLRMQDRLNPEGGGCEHAYSPSTGAVGMRNEGEEDDSPFRVFNVTYPMYRRSDEVTDWVSVGWSEPGK